MLTIPCKYLKMQIMGAFFQVKNVPKKMQNACKPSKIQVSGALAPFSEVPWSCSIPGNRYIRKPTPPDPIPDIVQFSTRQKTKIAHNTSQIQFLLVLTNFFGLSRSCYTHTNQYYPKPNPHNLGGDGPKFTKD